MELISYRNPCTSVNLGTIGIRIVIIIFKSGSIRFGYRWGFIRIGSDSIINKVEGNGRYINSIDGNVKDGGLPPVRRNPPGMRGTRADRCVSSDNSNIIRRRLASGR